MLVNQSSIKKFALRCAGERHHKFTRVSKEFIIYMESKTRQAISEYVRSLPSVGKTIKSLLILCLICVPAYAGAYVVSLPAGVHARVAPHFTAKEFACPHCRVRKVNGELLYRLELLRKELGEPIHITSGYRCPAHNRAAGGARRSQHLLGKAADVKAFAHTPIEVARAARRAGFSFIKVYPTWTHVDVR